MPTRGLDTSMQKEAKNGNNTKKVLLTRLKMVGIKLKAKDSGMNTRRAILKQKQDGALSTLKIVSLKPRDWSMAQKQIRLCRTKAMVQLKNRGMNNS